MVRIIFFFFLVCVITSFKPKEITWTAIGDSITYLNDHADETGNRISKGYMTMVTEKLPIIHYKNQGYNGWTSGGIAKEFDSLNVEKSDVYSVFLGTNDWWQGRPLGSMNDYKKNTGNETVNGSFRIIVDKLRALNPDAHIIMITPMKRVDFVYMGDMKNNAWGSYKAKNGQMLEQFAKAIDSISDYENFDLVDLYHTKGLDHRSLVKYKRMRVPGTNDYKNYTYPEFVDIPFNPEADAYPYPEDAIDMTYDGLHPSDKGYAVIAKKLIKVMKKYL
jgi:lysophospholipase L1-like esterase